MRIGLTGLADIAHRLWSAGTGAMSRHMERLSSGLRINSAIDDAAGLAISEGLTSRINGFDQGVRNAQDGISLTQTAEGGLASMHDTLQRMRALAVQAANGTYSAEDRSAMQREMNSLVEEIDSVVGRTAFNGQSLLDGSFAGRRVHTGPDSGDTVELDVARFDSVGLGLRDDGAALVDPDLLVSGALVSTGTSTTATVADPLAIDPAAASAATTTAPDPTATQTTTTQTATTQIARTNKNGKLIGGGKTAPTTTTAPTTATSPTTTTTPATTSAPASSGWSISVLDIDSAHEALTVLDDAIWSVSHGRADVGAVQNRLERTIRSASNARDDLDAARSRMRDADVAAEMSHLVRYQISTHAAAAMTAQAQVAMRNTATALLG